MSSLSPGPGHTVARAASILGHPMVLVPVAIALSMRGRVTARDSRLILGATLAALVFVFVYLVRGVRSGRLSHIDVSKREERSGFYRVSMLAMAGATAALYATNAPRAAVAGSAVAFALLAIGSLVNRVHKISLHTAFAVVAAGIVGRDAGAAFVAFALAAALVAWSRIALGRHTRLEVVTGLALGAAGAAAMAWVRTLS